jgi:4-amino-4-deoxy-L-arabinose transferase-like glycosyltransferase
MSRRTLFILLVIALAIPAFWINLDRVAIIDDEGIRAQVALEMIISGDYIVPTRFGDLYHVKPPLFNWMLIAFYEMTGSNTEWVARTVTLLVLALYTWVIYLFFRPHLGRRIALWSALGTMTCGRILFWDSMLGLIDMSFSLVIFTIFMVIYNQREKANTRGLYIYSYLLTAVAFMFKALPALVFQGLTLAAAWLDKRAWRKFFHYWHFIAGIMCVALLGIYYMVYAQRADIGGLVQDMLFDSTQRTPVHHAPTETMFHLVEYPFEMVYHFLPWSLLGLLLIRKDLIRLVKGNVFVRYLAVIFLANIWVYWISPEVYPRYLLMFCPLYFGVGFYLLAKDQEDGHWRSDAAKLVAVLLLVLSGLFSLVPWWTDLVEVVPHWRFKAIGLTWAFAMLGWGFFKRPGRYVEWAILTLLVFRIGFSLFILPIREAGDYGSVVRDNAIHIGERFQEEELQAYGDSYMNATTGYYLTRAYGDIVHFERDSMREGVYYILDTSVQEYKTLDVELVDTMRIRQNKRNLLIVKKR